MFSRIALFLAALTFAPLAFADAELASAAVRCSPNDKVFVLLPVIDNTLGDSLSVEILVKPKFKRLKGGRNVITCRLGNTRLRTVVSINPPSNGMDMAAGYISISEFKVDDKPIGSLHKAAFNWLSRNRSVTRITVSNITGTPSIEICSGSFDGSKYAEVKCAPEFSR
jgi:hypothetical protein